MKRIFGSIVAALAALGVLLAADARAQAPVVKRLLGKDKKGAEAPAAENPPPPASSEPPPAAAEPAAGKRMLPSEAMKAQGADAAAPGSEAAPASVPEEGAEPEKSTVGLAVVGGKARGSGSVSIDLGSEVSEAGSEDIFAKEEVRKLIGENPTFVYQSVGVSDPMIFPPIRREAMRNELWLKEEKLVAESKVDLKDPSKSPNADAKKIAEAVDLLQKIEKIGDERFRLQTEDRMGQLNDALRTLTHVDIVKVDPNVPTTTTPPPPKMPDKLADGVHGVIYNGATPICLILDSMLKVGETVPGFESFKIIAIEKDKVVFEASNEKIKSASQELQTRRDEISLGDFSNLDFWKKR